MLDKDTVDYILRYYSRFMTADERKANSHHLFMLQTEKSDALRKRASEMGWTTSNPEILSLLDNGIQEFRRTTAERIYRAHKNEIFFNNCLNCRKLARTPQAKQCRFCGYDWH